MDPIYRDYSCSYEFEKEQLRLEEERKLKKNLEEQKASLNKLLKYKRKF